MKTLFALISLLYISTDIVNSIYRGNECLQKCPPAFTVISTQANDESNTNFLSKFLASSSSQLSPRCMIDISNYAYISGLSNSETNAESSFNLEEYINSLDMTSVDSPHYCFADLHGITDETADSEPRWEALKIKSDLCSKYETMHVCNVMWPCAFSGMKEICDERGIYNCSTKSCDCWPGYIAKHSLSSSEDDFITCDIDIQALFEGETDEQRILPPIHKDFIIDGTFVEKAVNVDSYRLPNPISIRIFSQSYLLKQFNLAINDVSETMVDANQRELYLQYIKNVSDFDPSAIVNISNDSLSDSAINPIRYRFQDVDTLIFGITLKYSDWAAKPDLRAQSFKDLQIRFAINSPFASTPKSLNIYFHVFY